MNEEIILGIDWVRIGSVYGALFAFGLLYNALVAWLERHGYDEGYTAILVVFGAAITLLGVAVIDWRAALLAFGAFASSGFWMVVGSWWRHVQARSRSQKLLREQR